jgi:hypothetical protein
VNIFKQVQRLKTQLDQHTNLSETETQDIEQTMPADTQQAFKVMYLETAKQLQEKIDKNEAVIPEVEQLDFENSAFALSPLRLAIASGVFSNPWFSKKSANCCVASLSLLMVSDADSTSQISLDCSPL